MTSDSTSDPDVPASTGSTPDADSAGRSANAMRTLERSECLELLAATRFGRLAVTLGDGAPVIRPVNYVFDDRSQSVMFRTEPGSKFHALLHAARAAFEIDGIDPATRTGWSVIIVGVTEEVTNPGEIRRLDTLGLDVWALGDRGHWLRIRAGTVSGRRISPAG
jgi:uncharacterized protein